MAAYDYFAGLALGEPRDVIAEHRRRINHQIHQRWLLRDSLNPLDLSITEFMRLYRLPQHEVVRLAHILRPYIPVHTNVHQVPLIRKLLVALSFYASGFYQRMLVRSCDVSVSQTSASRFIHEITAALNHPEILRRFIRFPETHEERMQVIATNQRLGMPRVIGFIDGTLVRIKAPPYALNRPAYYSRKGWPAINAQIICDADLKVLNVNARFPGSCNDQHIWNNSAARNVVQNAYFEDRCWLLGDAGYFMAPWIHVPIPQALPGSREFIYTQLHMFCRNCVERCIGVIKARWRCLCTAERGLPYSPAFCGSIINACCVLHNFCVSRGIANPRPFVEGVPDIPPDFDDLLPDDFLAMALAERNYLIDYACERNRIIEEHPFY